MSARAVLNTVWGMLDGEQRAELEKTPEDRAREEQARKRALIAASGGEIG